MNLRQRLLYTTAIWLLLLAFLGLSEPGKLPVVMLIVPFLLLFTALYSLWGLLQQLGVRYFGEGKTEQTAEDGSLRKRRVVAGVAVIGPIDCQGCSDCGGDCYCGLLIPRAYEP